MAIASNIQTEPPGGQFLNTSHMIITSIKVGTKLSLTKDIDNSTCQQKI